MGMKISRFWAEVCRRERQERLELLDYLPALLYAMAGAPPNVPADRREEFVRPYKESFRKRITQEKYTTANLRNELQQKVNELETRYHQFKKLNDMEDKSFIDDWMSGKV